MSESKEWADNVLLGRGKFVVLDKDSRLGSAPLEMIDETAQLLHEGLVKADAKLKEEFFRKCEPYEGWISTEVCFPECDEIVLAFHLKEGVVVGYRWLDYPEDEEGPAEYAWDIQTFNSIRDMDAGFLWEDHTIAEDDEISHWMSRPKPPRLN